MMTTRTVGIVAVAASIGTVLAALYYIPPIVMKITEINERVRHFDFVIFMAKMLSYYLLMNPWYNKSFPSEKIVIEGICGS